MTADPCSKRWSMFLEYVSDVVSTFLMAIFKILHIFFTFFAKSLFIFYQKMSEAFGALSIIFCQGYAVMMAKQLSRPVHSNKNIMQTSYVILSFLVATFL